MSLHLVRPVGSQSRDLPVTPLAAYSPLTVSAAHGDVVIVVDPGTARDLAEAWATLHAVEPGLEAVRPRWFDEVVDIHLAATAADMTRGDVPDPVQVPLVRPGGGERP